MQKEVLQAYGNMDLQEGEKKKKEFFLNFFHDKMMNKK